MPDAQICEPNDMDVECIEREYLMSDDPSSSPPQMLKLLLEMVGMPIVIMLPALFLRFFDDFPMYNIFVLKGPGGLNDRMEFIRMSLYLALVYGTFIGLIILLDTLPDAFLWLVETAEGRISYGARRHRNHIRAVSHWIVSVMFMVALIIISASIVYSSSFLEHVTEELAAGSKEPSSAYLERLYVLFFIFLLILTMVKYAMEVLTYNFHRSAYLKRIYVSNFQYGVLQKLYLTLSRGIPTNLKGPSTLTSHPGYAYLAVDRGLDLTSAKRAQELSENLFQMLCPSNRSHIKMEDFRPYFDLQDVATAFSVFDRFGMENVSLGDFCAVVGEIYEERHNITRSLGSHSRIFSKIDGILVGAALVITMLFGVSLFKMEKAAFMIILGSAIGAFGFAMRTSMQVVHESVQFIFCEHAFDVGDRVILKGESLLVERIDLFTTILKKWDGTLVYMTNSAMAGATIYNLRRSGNARETLELMLANSTPMDRLWAFRDRLVEKVKANPKDFTGFADISSFDIIDSQRIKVVVLAEYRGNAQKAATLVSRRKLLGEIGKQSLAELGITSA